MTNLINQLKKLEGQVFSTMAKLFDAAIAAGVPNLEGFRSGGRNRKLAIEELHRYLETKPTSDIDPTCKKPSSVTVVKVYDVELPKENKTGEHGIYIDILKPLIMGCNSFHGGVDEFFASIGVFEKYRAYISEKEGNSKAGDNLWKTTPDMTPGEISYRSNIRNQERDILERALNALQKERKLVWEEELRYIPAVEIPNSKPCDTPWLKDIKTIEAEYEKRLGCAIGIASKYNCALTPDVVEKTDIRNGNFSNWLLYPNIAEYCHKCQAERKMIPLVATPTQIDAYKIYQKWMRQLTVFLDEHTGQYCDPANILNPYQLFSKRKLFKLYTELDKKLLPFVLGWKCAWTGISFTVSEEYWDKCELSPANAAKQSEQLTRLLVTYQDKQMGKRKFAADKNSLHDCLLCFGAPQPYSFYFLKESKAAQSLHNEIIGFYPVDL